MVVTTTVDTLQTIAPDIDALDAKVGDGDTGATFAAAARAVAGRQDLLPFADGEQLRAMTRKPAGDFSENGEHPGFDLVRPHNAVVN